MSIETRLRDKLPRHGEVIARLALLLRADMTPVVTVAGKYNHGKSSLLNELVGQPVFEVADRRMTVDLHTHAAGNIRWLDAPGLDADVSGADDRKAIEGALGRADVRLFVHSVKEGELDAHEVQWLQAFREDEKATGRPTLVVLSQADQMPDADTLASVCDAVKRQAGDLPCFLTSSTRHHKGQAENKQGLIRQSGMHELRAGIAMAMARVSQARGTEMASLVAALDTALRKKAQSLRRTRDRLVTTQESDVGEFVRGVERALQTGMSIMRDGTR